MDKDAIVITIIIHSSKKTTLTNANV